MNNLFGVSFKDFMRNYVKRNHKCYNYADYPKEIQNILETIYVACRRFMATPAHIIYILDKVLEEFEEIKDNYNKMKNTVNASDEIMNVHKEQIDKLNMEIEELKEEKELIQKIQKRGVSKKFSVVDIANYLGVSRQTIYNLKKRGGIKCK